MYKVTGYIYDVETKEIATIVIGEQCDVERYADNYDSDTYGLTYSPAIGAGDGLVETLSTITIEL